MSAKIIRDSTIWSARHDDYILQRGEGRVEGAGAGSRGKGQGASGKRVNLLAKKLSERQTKQKKEKKRNSFGRKTEMKFENHQLVNTHAHPAGYKV